jgi:hypothetical protein
MNISSEEMKWQLQSFMILQLRQANTLTAKDKQKAAG